jgi:predicted transcriptional regulator
MLDSLITSKTRVKLLLKFFLNPESRAYLRELAEELGESTNGVRIELNRLTEAGLLQAENNGRTKVYRANITHPLFPDIQNMVKKYLGIDHLIHQVLTQLGTIQFAFVTGDYAQGKDSGIIDLVIVGNIDRSFLFQLIDKAERIIKRKIRTLILTNDEFLCLKSTLKLDKALVVWGE